MTSKVNWSTLIIASNKRRNEVESILFSFYFSYSFLMFIDFKLLYDCWNFLKTFDLFPYEFYYLNLHLCIRTEFSTYIGFSRKIIRFLISYIFGFPFIYSKNILNIHDKINRNSITDFHSTWSLRYRNSIQIPLPSLNKWFIFLKLPKISQDGCQMR